MQKRNSLASGAKAAKQLLKKIEQCNQRSSQETGEPDLVQIAVLIERALANEENRPGIILGMAEFICIALDGATTASSAWKPLQNLIKRSKRAS